MISDRKVKKIVEFYRKIYDIKMIKFRLNLFKVRIFDVIHGTDFGGRIYHGELGISRERANDYSATPYELMKSLKKLNITPKDSIADLGSGKGFALFYMSKFAFAKIAGIELSERMVNICNDNIRKLLPNDKRINVECCDAAIWGSYDEYNMFYIYNSFPKKVMKEVLQSINQSIERRPRKVLILYLYPEWAEVFERDKKWKLISRGNEKELRKGMHIFTNT